MRIEFCLLQAPSAWCRQKVSERKGNRADHYVLIRV